MTVKRQLFQHESRIISCRRICTDCYLHEYEAPEIARSAKPGQFVKTRVTAEYAPLLPRPFSILDVDKERGTIFVLFKVVGRSTVLLAGKKEGDTVGLLGPLGNTFNTKPYGELFLIAGGIGIPPVYFLLKTMDFSMHNVRLFYGAASKEDLYLADELQKMNVPLEFATEDGSFGKKGLITSIFESTLYEYKHKSDACILTCGPMPMLAEVQRIACEYSIPAQLSVETIMACGTGICQGCALPKKVENGEVVEYCLACIDGPVFSENELVIQNG